ncbi:cylicin-1 [Crocuta crocuta]
MQPKWAVLYIPDQALFPGPSPGSPPKLQETQTRRLASKEQFHLGVTWEESVLPRVSWRAGNRVPLCVIIQNTNSQQCRCQVWNHVVILDPGVEYLFSSGQFYLTFNNSATTPQVLWKSHICAKCIGIFTGNSMPNTLGSLQVTVVTRMSVVTTLGCRASCRYCYRHVPTENTHIVVWASTKRSEANCEHTDNFEGHGCCESNRKLWDQDYFTLTFPKPLQPGRKKRSRPSELQISVPSHDKRKLNEVEKPAHIGIKHSFNKNSKRPSVYLKVGRQAPFRNPYTPKTNPENGESKKSKYDKKGRTLQRNSKKNKDRHETTPESKTVNDEEPERGNKADKGPSKLSHKSELSEDSKSKLETNPESRDFKTVSMDPKKDKIQSKNSNETDNEYLCAKKHSKGSKNNSDVISQTCLKNSSNMDFILYLKESGAESMKLDVWLKNYSQNNSKKSSKKDTKKDAKKSSDAESVDSKDAKKNAKKDKKSTEKDGKKKGAKKDTESTDAESVDSKNAKKASKKAKKDSKKNDKKKDAKRDTESTDVESLETKDAKKDSKKAKKDSKKDDKKKDRKRDTVYTDAESESELETKKWKKDEKQVKKEAKENDKKKANKKDTVSTDADSESEWDSKKGKKDKKKDKRNSKKGNSIKSAMKSEESTETESDWESKKDKYDSKKTNKVSKKDAKKQDARKGIESNNAESDESSKKDSKKQFKSSDAESEDSLYKLEAKNNGVDESDATSTDSKKKALELKREIKISSKKTTFKEKGKKVGIGRVPPSRERPPLPPCEPLLPSPKVKRLCQCNMPPPPLKPRYAPLRDSFDPCLIKGPGLALPLA